MNAADHIADAFETIALGEMDKVKLMDRTDTKFIFPQSLLPAVLERLSPHYRILQQNSISLLTYKTLYFDTRNLDLYLKHHNGHLNRYKIRYRNYADSGDGFLEVKLKTNKGRTVKERIGQQQQPLLWTREAYDFLKEKTPYYPELLEPSLWINFQRMTFVGKAHNERVTLDLNLEFLAGTESKRINNLVFAEVKQASRMQTPVMESLRSLRIREGALSKYCLGVMHLYPKAKKNNFKQQLNRINKAIL